MSEWRPIETAPRDGAPILLWECDDKEICIGWFISSGDLVLEGPDHYRISATHWMPLPEPPEGESDDR